MGLAGAAGALGAGVEDVVVAGGGHVDVVRRIAPPGRAPVVVHLRLHPGRGDIGAARRALASTLLHRDLVDGDRRDGAAVDTRAAHAGSARPTGRRRTGGSGGTSSPRW